MFFLHLISLALGLLFLYSLFFTEAEDRKLVNADAKLCSKLQDWWDRLDATKNRNISAHARFMRGVAELTTARFDRLFGKRLFSAQVVGVSACYKVASLFLGSLTLLLIAEYVFHIPFAIPARDGRRVALTSWIIPPFRTVNAENNSSVRSPTSSLK